MSLPSEIQEHRRRLLALARHLVSDLHRAEDLVQDTYVSALERGAAEEPLGWARSWRRMRETLRLKAREAFRQEDRRKRRERAAAARECDESGVPGRDEPTYLTAIAEEVERLEEPYRTTLRLRFLDEWPPRRIARELALPVQTVYSRIGRGSALLRERLERRLGALAPLLLLARGARTTPPRAQGVRPPRFAVAAGAAVAAVAAGTALWVAAVDPGSLDGDRAVAGAWDVVARAPDLGPAAPVRVLAPIAVDPLVAPPRAVDPDLQAGRVVDSTGRPVAGAEVSFERGILAFLTTSVEQTRFTAQSVEARTTSRADGSFELALSRTVEGRVIARSSGLAPLVAVMVPVPLGIECIELVVAPAARLGGVVLDRERTPVRDAYVVLRAPAAFLAALEHEDRTWHAGVHAVTDAEGRFALQDAWDLPGSRVELYRSDLTRHLVLAGGERELELVVEELCADGESLRGYVVTPTLEPIAGAGVFAGRENRRSAADGSFELPLAALEELDRIWAVARGSLPVAYDLPRLANGRLDLPPEILVEIGEHALAITGTVVDSDGRPIPRARVWCADPTPFAPDLTGGVLEVWIAGENAGDPYVVADAGGAFVLPHLMRRAYRVGALERATLRSVVSEPIAAGSRDIVLTIATDAPLEPFDGVAVDVHGAPLAGVTLSLERP